MRRDVAVAFSTTTAMADERRRREATGRVLRRDAELRLGERRALVEAKRSAAVARSRRARWQS